MPDISNLFHVNAAVQIREQVIVHFAGGGGSCRGITRATGQVPNHAVNHCPVALSMHRANHHGTEHHNEDVFLVDPRPIIRDGGPIGLAWFSPSCTHFSKAKGGQPLDKRIRGLVLVMLKWAKVDTRIMFMENVEECRTWGPLIQMWKNGQQDWYPDPQQRGRTWQAFTAAMSTGVAADHPDLPFFMEVLAGISYQEVADALALPVTHPTVLKGLEYRAGVKMRDLVKGFGYAFEAKELRACDYGAPTIRKRLYAVFRNDKQPIVWPAPSHGDPATLLEGDTRKPWRTMAECIDWTRPCPSIFLRGKAAKKARCKRPLAEATLRRIAKGVDKYVLKSNRPFIVSLTHQGGERVENIDQPVNTLTGAHRGEKALCTALVTECANGSSQRNMPIGEPMRTACAETKGGQFALIAGTCVNTCNGKFDDAPSRAMNPEAPLPAVTGTQKFAAVACSLVNLHGTNVSGNAANEPAPTISAGGQHHGLLAASVVIQNNGGFNATPAHPVDAPVSTLGATGSQQQLLSASIVAFYGSEEDGQGVEEPARTTTAKARFSLVESHLNAPVMTREHIKGAERVARFLRRYGVEFEGEYATVKGLVIVDLGLRMFTPRELFTAMGFPNDRVLCYGTGWRKTEHVPCVDPSLNQMLKKDHVNDVKPAVENVQISFDSTNLGGSKENRTPVIGRNAFASSAVVDSIQESTTTEADHSKHVGLHVEINCEQKTCYLSSNVQRLSKHANAAESREKFLLSTKLADSVRKLVQSQKCAGQRGPIGKVETSTSNRSFTTHVNGWQSRSSFGGETTGSVNCAEDSTTTTSTVEPGLYITLAVGQSSLHCDSMWKTLCYFVTRVMALSTQEQIRNASSFDLEVELVSEYIIDRGEFCDPTTGEMTTRRLTKEEQIRMCGNAVCPDVAEALVRANAPEMCLGGLEHG